MMATDTDFLVAARVRFPNFDRYDVAMQEALLNEVRKEHAQTSAPNDSRTTANVSRAFRVAAVEATSPTPRPNPIADRLIANARQANMATEKQVSWVTSMMTEKWELGGYGDTAVFTREMFNDTLSVCFETLTKSRCSVVIDELKAELRTLRANRRSAAPVATAQPAAAALQVGMYRKANGDLIRVYPARAGHLLAAKLVQETIHELLARGARKAEFDYLGGASRFVTADERMSVEEAAAYGHAFGVCCMCGALLTDPNSVAAGIGPICAGKVA